MKLKMMTDIIQDRIYYALRIVIGVIVSILLAEAFNVKFAPSTGVIALLSIQPTRRETLNNIGVRIISAIYSFAISLFVHHLIGHGTLAFSLTLLFVILVSISLGWARTLSVNVVIVMHLFIQNIPINSGLVLNEVIRLFIGLSLAIVVNVYIPNQEGEFATYFHHLEEKIQILLKDYSCLLKGLTTSKKLQTQLDDIEKTLGYIKQKVIRHNNNKIKYDNSRYMNYVEMRNNELEILKHMHLHLEKLPHGESSSEELAHLLDMIAEGTTDLSSVAENIHDYQATKTAYNSLPVPTSREKFTIEIIMYQLLDECWTILEARNRFFQNNNTLTSV